MQLQFYYSRWLCEIQDLKIILPNITESRLLTGMPNKTHYDIGYIRELLEKLLTLGYHTAALTGVSYEPDSARWYGVEFESQIPLLCQMLEEKFKK